MIFLQILQILQMILFIIDQICELRERKRTIQADTKGPTIVQPLETTILQSQTLMTMELQVPNALQPQASPISQQKESNSDMTDDPMCTK